MLLLLAVVVVSVAAGYALGGRLSAFESVTVKLWWLALIALAVQLVPASSHAMAIALLMLSYVGLVVFAAANLRARGFALILIGLALNWLVIGLNGGMPVTEKALVSSGQADTLQLLETEGGAKHHLSDGDALLFLGDVIPVGAPISQVVSIGDVLVYAGMIWFVVSTMRGRRNEAPE